MRPLLVTQMRRCCPRGKGTPPAAQRRGDPGRLYCLAHSLALMCVYGGFRQISASSLPPSDLPGLLGRQDFFPDQTCCYGFAMFRRLV